MPPVICCIDGNIGAGKTTILKELEKRGYRVFEEDIRDWGWCLEEYYEDPKNNAFKLQVAILCSMFSQKTQMLSLPVPVVFIERSPRSGMVFSKVCMKRGLLSVHELTLLENLSNCIGWIPDVTIYLDSPVERCLQRIRTRDRECERTIDAGYLIDIENSYADNVLNGENVMTIVDDCRDVDSLVDLIIGKIESYVL